MSSNGCKGLCSNEPHKGLSGRYPYSHSHDNAKCIRCEYRTNSNEVRCYCCKYPYRRRQSVSEELSRKEKLGLIARY